MILEHDPKTLGDPTSLNKGQNGSYLCYGCVHHRSDECVIRQIKAKILREIVENEQ